MSNAMNNTRILQAFSWYKAMKMSFDRRADLDFLNKTESRLLNEVSLGYLYGLAENLGWDIQSSHDENIVEAAEEFLDAVNDAIIRLVASGAVSERRSVRPIKDMRDRYFDGFERNQRSDPNRGKPFQYRYHSGSTCCRGMM